MILINVIDVVEWVKLCSKKTDDSYITNKNVNIPPIKNTTKPILKYTALQSKKSVSAHLIGKGILPFGFAWQ